MTTKDYKKIADVLGRTEIGIVPKFRLVREFARMFAEDNPNFSYSKFEKAVMTIHDQRRAL
jgi:hypothetical protein